VGKENSVQLNNNNRVAVVTFPSHKSMQTGLNLGNCLFPTVF